MIKLRGAIISSADDTMFGECQMNVRVEVAEGIVEFLSLVGIGLKASKDF